MSNHKLFGYPGGKWPMRHMIVSAFPVHSTYVDVFGGSAAILLSKEPSKGEVFNDINDEIVNFFRVVKHRPAELVERSRHWIHSRNLWTETRDTNPPADELERAFRFWVVVLDSFGGIGGTFGTSRIGVRSVSRARDYLTAVADRLRSVHVEHLDFRKCISMYDGPDSFFYLDPPYRKTKGGETHYNDLTDDDWREMATMLSNLQGRFLLSHTDDLFVRKLFSDFRIRTTSVRVTLSRSKKENIRREIMVSNYHLPKKILQGIKAPSKGDRNAVRATKASMQTVRRSASRQHVHGKG